MLGRATGVQDRAHRSALAYDARGNAVWTARQLAYLPDAPALVYERDGLPRTTHWGAESLGTSSTTRYDIRRRPVRMTTTRSATGTGLQAVSTVVDQQLVWDAASNSTTATPPSGRRATARRART